MLDNISENLINFTTELDEFNQFIDNMNEEHNSWLKEVNNIDRQLQQMNEKMSDNLNKSQVDINKYYQFLIRKI